MNPNFSHEDGERMDIDGVARASNTTPPISASSRRHQPAPLLPRLPPHETNRNPPSTSGPYDRFSETRSERPFHYDTPPPSLRYDQRYQERYDRNHPPSEYPPDQSHNGSPYDHRSSLNHREYYSHEISRHGYNSHPQEDIRSFSHEGYPTDLRDRGPSLSYFSPRPRPHRHPRDRSPRSYPHYPHDYRSRPYSDERGEYRDRREYLERPPLHERDDFRSEYTPPQYRRPRTPDHRESMTAEQRPANTDRFLHARYTNVGQEYPRRRGDDAFTFVHRPIEHGHSRGRSMEERREPLLPPARELLSVSPELMMPGMSYSREARIDLIDRSHSAGELLIRPKPSEYSRGLSRAHSFHTPEDILESMRGLHNQPYPRTNPTTPEQDRFPATHAHPDIAAMERYEATRPIDPTNATPSHRSQGVTSVAPRTGFPSSGLRSTAPPTPPNPRTSHHDSVTFHPRFPGPSLGPIPKPPPPTVHSHSQPTSSSVSFRPRLERSRTTPGARSPAPSPGPLRSTSGASKPRSHIPKMILASVQREELPKSSSSPPGSQPTPPPRAKSPSPHILSLSFPRLVPTSHLPRTSARVCLVPPPYRDPIPERTKEQDRAYAEWLFESSSNVQRCMARAVSYCQDDLLRAADELLVTTHWIVLYMHQLGLSYYSQMRHEMRVAFWWKLNWSWFCVIQCSYNEATKSINETEIEPFPDDEAIRGYSEGEMEIDLQSSVKKEETAIDSPAPRSSDQDTISEPMEEVVAQQSMSLDVPQHLRVYWEMAKRLNAKPRWPKHLGGTEWLQIGDMLVEFGNELAKYGLLDMDLGLWENEIMHRIIAVLDAWQDRDRSILHYANAEFRKLGVEEKKVMVMAIKDDDTRMREQRS